MRSRWRAWLNWAAQGPADRQVQRPCRALWMSRPGRASSRRRRVLATTVASGDAAELGRPAQDVLGEGGQDQPGGVGVKDARVSEQRVIRLRSMPGC